MTYDIRNFYIMAALKPLQPLYKGHSSILVNSCPFQNLLYTVSYNYSRNRLFFIIVAWLFLHETLKKTHNKTDAKILNTTPTNDSDVINDSMETVGNDLIGDLEKGGEHLPLLGSHGHRKTSVLFCF